MPSVEISFYGPQEQTACGDGAFASPEIYEALEERGVKYAIRLPAKDCRERDIAELLPPPGAGPLTK
jgi:hypothetical protein